MRNLKRKIVITRVAEDGSVHKIVKDKGFYQVDRDSDLDLK